MAMNEPEPQRQRATVEKIIGEYDKSLSQFVDFCNKVRPYLEELLRKNEIPFQTVLHRIKDREKVRTKYERPSKSGKYLALNDITDIAGLRVITYYEDDIDAVREVIESAFEIDRENIEDKREPEDPENFSYHALHLIVSLKPSTLGDHTFGQLRGIRGEIQITSVLRHAWAEIAHKWYDLDDRFPRNVKRRFARLSALIDLADEQFVQLRDEWDQANSSIDRSLEGGFMDIQIDTQSLRAFIAQEPLVSEIDSQIGSENNYIVDGDLIEPSVRAYVNLLSAIGITTIGRLKDALAVNRSALVEYAGYLAPSIRRETFVQPLFQHGFSIQQLGMMIFLTKSCNNLSGIESADSIAQMLEQKVAEMGFRVNSGDDIYRLQALPAMRILSKFGH
jgi:ppGpp synthetase/RelA/SpoT-type nucleotidyltranferase